LSHRDEVDLIKRRALRMLAHAESSIEEGDYDLAAFLAEQAAQLYVKQAILRLTGEVPRTHSIRQLLHMLGEILGDAGREAVVEFASRNRMSLAGLEDAYLAARYLYRIYEREEAEQLLEAARRVIRLVRDLEVEAGDG